MWAIMFGHKNAVMGLNRLSRFLEVIPRRILCLLWTMYYDDGSLQDLAAARGESQMHVKELFEVCGFKFSDPQLA